MSDFTTPVPSSEKPVKNMSKEELISRLKEFGYTDDQLNLKRPKLVQLLKMNFDGVAAAEALANVTAEPDPPIRLHDEKDGAEEEQPFADKIITPVPTSYEWTEYVLGLLHEDEQVDGNPTVDGLRRVAEMLVGEIAGSESQLIDPPNLNNSMRACVSVRITFMTKAGGKVFMGLADVFPGNCDPEFARFATSTAETRAEARAYRKALKLRKTVAAEEMTTIPFTEAAVEGNISAGQITAIQILADRLNVSIPKILTSLELNKTELNTLTRQEAMSVANRLNMLQQAQTAIPAELLRT